MPFARAALKRKESDADAFAPDHPPLDFDGLVAFTQNHVTDAIGEVTDPTVDITPAAFACRGPQLEMIVIPPETFDSERSKRSVFGQLLPGLIRQHHTSLFGLTLTVFSTGPKAPSEITEQEQATLAQGRVPADWPPPQRWRRREERLVHVFAPDREEVWQAAIVRVHRLPPQLGIWTHVGATARGGELITAIRAAIREQAAPSSG